MMRPSRSVPPLAANGTTIVTGRSGQFCAADGLTLAANATQTESASAILWFMAWSLSAAGQDFQHPRLLLGRHLVHDLDHVTVGRGRIEIFDDALDPLALGDELRIGECLLHGSLQVGEP